METRHIKRYIPPNCDFEILEIERTDYLQLSGCTPRQIPVVRVLYLIIQELNMIEGTFNL